MNIRWNIFDFGYKSAQLQKAKIGYMIAKLQKEDTALKLRSSIVEANKRIIVAKAKIASTQKEVELLKKIKEVEEIKYKKGASDMYDLLYAIAKYEEAKSALEEAKYNLDIQKAYFNYVTAGE